jgi:ribonuclease HI
MPALNKKKILERGWSEEAINFFIGSSPSVSAKGEDVWDPQLIKRIEDTLDFKGFTTEEEFKKRNILVKAEFTKLSQQGIKQVNTLGNEFETHDCLTKSADKFNPLKPIYHLVKKDFSPEPNGSYSLFTDGSFKTIDGEPFASCAGWILDNKTKEIVVEFTKILDPHANNKSGIPDFELIGISEGVKVVSQLGLKNVKCYTDCYEEAKIILGALNNIGDKKYNSNLAAYQEVVDNLKKTNSSIGWVPREYNKHADKLSRIPLNAWTEQKKPKEEHKTAMKI